MVLLLKRVLSAKTVVVPYSIHNDLFYSFWDDDLSFYNVKYFRWIWKVMSVEECSIVTFADYSSELGVLVSWIRTYDLKIVERAT